MSQTSVDIERPLCSKSRKPHCTCSQHQLLACLILFVRSVCLSRHLQESCNFCFWYCILALLYTDICIWMFLYSMSHRLPLEAGSLLRLPRSSPDRNGSSFGRRATSVGGRILWLEKCSQPLSRLLDRGQNTSECCFSNLSKTACPYLKTICFPSAAFILSSIASIMK